MKMKTINWSQADILPRIESSQNPSGDIQMTYSYRTTPLLTPDRAYGEIYEADGYYWAESILFSDGVEWVTGKSEDFASRREAAAWLAKRGLTAAVSFEDSLADGIRAIFDADIWKRIGSLVRPIQTGRHSAA